MNQYKPDHYLVNVLVATRHSGSNMQTLVRRRVVEARPVEEVRHRRDSRPGCMGLQELGRRTSTRVVVVVEEGDLCDHIQELGYSCLIRLRFGVGRKIGTQAVVNDML